VNLRLSLVVINYFNVLFFFYLYFLTETSKSDFNSQSECKETNKDDKLKLNFIKNETSNEDPFSIINDLHSIPKVLSKSTNRKKLDELPKFNSLDTYSEKVVSPFHSSFQFKSSKSVDNDSSAKFESLSNKKNPFDPFDVDWVSLETRSMNNIVSSTNPFASAPTPVKTFQVKL